ncbi:uncharacterized protein LOC115244927 isoform X4 [Formica exsecta]|uniref:uncharacterized protein LOC115244927 isoform X4 n=1 Tax=Formica exsecta TaxID=72781 RepID=UPI001141D6D6|nr:uncharacterized protein LOC115244927 isoform X4 [Formica exsecta]
MDSLTEPTPAKKRCVTRNENKMQLIECVREFRLPQQFPSTLKQAMKQGIVNPVESPPSILTMPENMITSLSDVKFQIPYKLQKLRILSPNGKDLGEFNIELQTDNPLKGKMITLRPVKKPVLSPVSHSRIFPRILKQGTARIFKNNLIKSCSRCDSETNEINASQESTTLRINKMIEKQDIETRNKEAQNTISTQEYNIAVSPASEKNVINVHHGKVLHDTKSENMQSKHVLKKDSGNNCSAVVVNNPVQRVPESQPITNTTNTIVQLDVQNRDYPTDSTQSDLADQWNIIKKAMDSVKDNKLRALALKALADCGIGIERYVPIHLPEKHKAVHDTQIQTMVFGLLDPTSFIFINKDLDSIQRIKQISLYDMPTNQDQLLTNGLHSNDSLSKVPLTNEQEDDFDIDSFIKQIFEEDSDTAKMKETLSATKIRCKNLIEHLERDFESVKHYDQNGMLNIHNAVISNNIHLVQRQLMILEQCKENVDILTEDGATSLELAIKYDARSEIVKLLLKAGAQPVIPKYIHESALIIASKRSSPLLSMLIDQVSESKLLDQIDSEGFAALHYCSMRDNLQGVKALLSAGAAIDVKDMKSGRTPLFHALDNGHTILAQTLLKAGAIANVTNYAGQTPLPIVSEKFVFQNIN